MISGDQYSENLANFSRKLIAEYSIYSSQGVSTDLKDELADDHAKIPEEV